MSVRARFAFYTKSIVICTAVIFSPLKASTAPVANSIYNLTGFGRETIGGGTIATTDSAYRQVKTPLELAQAIQAANKTAGAVRVIEIMNDLDLGWNEIGAPTRSVGAFRAHAKALLHPRLIVTGVSVVEVKPQSGLTLFSANGATVRHATFNIKGTSNIIVRNLKFDELWEWDESSRGRYDKNNWDFIELGGGNTNWDYINLRNGGATNNVWIDHCTFTKAYDGIIDMREGTSNVTFSWCRCIGDDSATNPQSFVRQQIDALEAKKTSYPFYNFLRSNGFSGFFRFLSG